MNAPCGEAEEGEGRALHAVAVLLAIGLENEAGKHDADAPVKHHLGPPIDVERGERARRDDPEHPPDIS